MADKKRTLKFETKGAAFDIRDAFNRRTEISITLKDGSGDLGRALTLVLEPHEIDMLVDELKHMKQGH